MNDLLFLPDLTAIEPPRFNQSAFGHAMSNFNFEWDEVTDHDITDNFGVDFSTFIKILEKSGL